jgi:hypothetical protein
MPGLNLEQDPIRKINSSRSKRFKLVFGAIILLAIPVVGTTLAASITINSNSAVQFGQGVVQATSCDDAIAISANSSFYNASGAGSFNVDTVTASGVSDACSGKTFTIRAYDTTTATALTVNSGGTPTNALVFVPTISGSTCTIAITGSTFTTSVCTYSANANSIAVRIPTTLNAASVYKFTIETS